MTPGPAPSTPHPIPGAGWRLDRSPIPPAPPLVPDPHQAAVLAHGDGPLLVLAGPGTGKTATLVEAVAERVRRGTPAEQILVLTFSRKAAEELRERIAGRLGADAPGPGPQAWTFHAWCLALVTGTAAAADSVPPRLLSGPERLVRIRELLRGAADGDGTTRWPPGLRAALPTRGMAREVGDLLDRARERGVEPADLRRLAAGEHRPDWTAAAEFFEEYAAVLGSSAEMDYADLTRQALLLLDDPQVVAETRARLSAVFVDEYQDTDPAQEELLQALAGDGRDLVVVGDPDQAIYAFRGADVGCLLGFPDRFPAADGSPAPVLALGMSRRAGSTLLAASRAVATRLSTPGLAVPLVRAHRELTAAPGLPDGEIEVRLFATGADQASAVADLLRRARLTDDLPWSEMAVLVRSGSRDLPVLRRALVAAGVPVAVASDELPVARDPAVVPLLLALRCADDPALLDDDTARLLLTSPLVRATPSALRRLGRALRRVARDDLAAETAAARADSSLVLPPPSATLIRDAVARPAALLAVDDRDEPVARPPRRLAELLSTARDLLGAGAGAEQALWSLWDGSGWSRRLAASSAAGGAAGRAADRDLDAVVGLFDALARLEERRPRAGVGVLLDELEAQEIPGASRAEGVLAGGGAVRLLTAHRAKGLEWELVVVASVQDGGWPDLRRRGSLLDGDRLGRTSAVPAPTTTALLVDERRLFYTAVTRARRRLVVTAVASPDEDGERPSRFLGELGVPLPDGPERPTATLSLPSLVARLRALLLQPGTSPADAEAAAADLARLAAAGVRGADPDGWWGLLDPTPGAAPVRSPDAPLALSGSAVSGYDTCPLAWFLEREVRAARPSTAAQGFGLAVHVLARLVATGVLPPELPALETRLDAVWPALGFDAPWQADRERREAVAALTRFLAWHGSRGREWLASEAAFSVEVGDALLRGSVDRLERDPDGRLVVVDLKTGATAPTAAEVTRHAQLGIYQLVAREGGLVEVAGDDVRLGGAELVHLRQGVAKPKVQPQAPLEGDGWADELLGRVVSGMRAEEFPARPSSACSRCSFARACPAQDEGGQVVR